MGKKIIGDCPRCGRKNVRLTAGVCHSICYRRYIWKRKKKICKRCGRMLFIKAKDLCGGCYNTVYMLEYQKDRNYLKYHNIDPSVYRHITKSCLICGFDKVVDLHHLDKNHKNNSRENMIGLCPNHHRMLHDLRYVNEITNQIKEKLETAGSF